MTEDKKKWVKDIEMLLRCDKRSHLQSTNYYYETRNGWKREVIEVVRTDGSVAELNVTGDSLKSILSKIINEAYKQEEK